MRRIGLILLLALSAACSTTRSLEDLRRAPLSGESFNIALARHYLEFSESELRLYDWWTSKYFADKGLMAAYGTKVPPEQLENWNISNQARPELEAARTALLAVLTDTLKKDKPEQAADLQYRFDRWVEEQDEGWDEATIAQHRKDFYSLLKKVQQPSKPAETLPPKAETKEKAVEKPALSLSYLVHFPWDASTVDGMARDELEAIGTALKAHPDAMVVINGHADRSGDDDYNLSLSQQRADFIRTFLRRLGIADNRIRYYAFGESDPLVPTADGIKEPANRRVEITIE